MSRQKVIEYIEHHYGALPEYPWRQYPHYAFFRHPKKAKWFAVIMDVELSKLTQDSQNSKIVDIINLKVLPEIAGSLRLKKGGYPAYHMNKEHWVSIVLDEDFEEAQLYTLIHDSYDLIK